MTDATLQSLILSTPALKTLAIAGSDMDILQAIPANAPQASVAVPFTASGLLQLLSQASVANVMKSNALGPIQECVLAQDVAGIETLAQGLVDSSSITTSEQTAINGAVTATRSVPDASVVDVNQISRVLAQFRTNGRAGQANWTGG